MIEVVNVSKKFKNKKVIENLNLNISKGEMIGVVGRNGAGKTTLIKMLTGILYPSSGTIMVDGKSPYKNRKKYVADIGVVFGQKTQLSYDLTPMDTYGVLKCIYRIKDDLYKENLERFIELMEVKECINRPVYQLSLGQKMRAEIICALLHSPSILFLDEPTIGIDIIGKEKIRNCLLSLNKTDNITVIITSHDMKDIEEVCDRVIMLDSGKICYDGSMKGLKERYSAKRVMEVELSNDIEIVYPGVIIEKVENKPNCRRLFFDNKSINYNELINVLLNEYQIKDICVRETEFEEIIKDILI